MFSSGDYKLRRPVLSSNTNLLHPIYEQSQLFQLTSVLQHALVSDTDWKRPAVQHCTHTHTHTHTCLLYTSRPIVFGEDRLRERGSLPATVFINGNFCFHIPQGMEVW